MRIRLLLFLWGIHASGLCLFGQSNQVFSIIDAGKGLSDNQTRCFLQLPDGRMAITTHGNVNFYDGVSVQTPYRTLEHLYHLEGYKRMYQLFITSDTLLWVKDRNRLMLINLRQNAYVKEISSVFQSSGIRDSIYDIYADSLQNLYLLDKKDQLWRKKHGENHSQILLKKASYVGNSCDPIYEILSIRDDLYVSRRSGLVICYDRNTWKEKYRRDVLKDENREQYADHCMSAVSTSGIYQIRSGNDGKGNWKGMVFYYDFSTRQWEQVLKTNVWIYSVTTGPSGQIRVNTPTGIWATKGKDRELIYSPSLSLVDGSKIEISCNNAFYDRQGGLWIASDYKGAFYYHPDRFKLKQVGSILFSGVDPKTMSVDAFSEKGDGQFYVRSGNTNFYVYDSRTESLSPFHPSEELIRKIDPDSPWQAWGGTVRFTDSRGWKWSGAWCGLTLHDPETGKERVFYKEDGLSNNAIRSIVEDHERTIWVSTANGISRIIPSEDGMDFRIVSYDVLDGAINGEFSRQSALVAADGTLLFGGFGGFNIVDFERLRASHVSFVPLFTGFYMKGIQIQTGQSYSGNVILPQVPAYTQELVLNHDQNFVTFCFSALNFINPLQSHYRFRLEGVDTEWQEQAGTDGLLRASYTDLSPGTYRFQVYAAGNDKLFDGPCTEIEVLVKAPFWATPFAYVLYAVGLFAIVLLGLRLYRSSVKRKLDRVYKEEFLLLRIKNLLEECDRYQDLLKQEEEKGTSPEIPSGYENKELSERIELEKKPLSSEEIKRNEFLSSVIDRIESNLNNVDYSVEQLSNDLCMDRTGLYRKLTAIIDKSPAVFIRSIRLQRAAQLLADGNLTISEISYRTGFGSPGYFTRCFQKEYGMTPSEYIEKTKQGKV